MWRRTCCAEWDDVKMRKTMSSFTDRQLLMCLSSTNIWTDLESACCWVELSSPSSPALTDWLLRKQPPKTRHEKCIDSFEVSILVASMKWEKLQSCFATCIWVIVEKSSLMTSVLIKNTHSSCMIHTHSLEKKQVSWILMSHIKAHYQPRSSNFSGFQLERI